MKMRIASLAALLFFSLAPSALAQTNATCLAYGPTTGCTVSPGVSGICDASNICRPTNTQVTPNNPAPSGSPVTLINPLGTGTTLSSFLLSILSIVTDIIGPVIVILMLVFVGFKFVVAQGVPAKIEEARGMLLWTVIGALILLGAKVIAMGILATVNALAGG